MKRTFTLLLILTVTIVANAQSIQKGTLFLGGNIGFSNQIEKNDDTDVKVKNNTLSLNPSIGRFYNNNRMFGVNLNYTRQRRSDGSLKGNYYGVGVFLRQYIPIGKSFYLFAEEGLSAQTGKSKENIPAASYIYDKRSTSFDLYAYPGIAYSITKRLQLDLSLNRLLNINYNRQKENYQGQVTAYNKTVSNFSLQTGAFENSIGYLSLGMQWLIP